MLVTVKGKVGIESLRVLDLYQACLLEDKSLLEFNMQAALKSCLGAALLPSLQLRFLLSESSYLEGDAATMLKL